MPTYDFQCKNKKCGKIFADLTTYDAEGKYPGVQCPYCRSKRKTRLFTGSPVIAFKNPEGTSKADNPEWMFGHKLEKAQEERRQAQEASHMGESPYRHIDDLNSSEDYFGEVK